MAPPTYRHRHHHRHRHPHPHPHPLTPSPPHPYPHPHLRLPPDLAPPRRFRRSSTSRPSSWQRASSTRCSTTPTPRNSCGCRPTKAPELRAPLGSHGRAAHLLRLCAAARSTAFFTRHLPPLEANRAVALYASFGRESPQRSELLRCCLLFQYGGVWLDIEAALMQPLHAVFPHRHVAYTTVSTDKVTDRGRGLLQGGVADAAPPGLRHFKRSIELLLGISPRMVAMDKHTWAKQASALLREELDVPHALRPGAYHGHAWELLAESCLPSSAAGLAPPDCRGDPLRLSHDTECCTVRARDDATKLLTVWTALAARGRPQSSHLLGLGDAGRRAATRLERAGRAAPRGLVSPISERGSARSGR